jgi:hypothetical protein
VPAREAAGRAINAGVERIREIYVAPDLHFICRRPPLASLSMCVRENMFACERTHILPACTESLYAMCSLSLPLSRVGLGVNVCAQNLMQM